MGEKLGQSTHAILMEWVGHLTYTYLRKVEMYQIFGTVMEHNENGIGHPWDTTPISNREVTPPGRKDINPEEDPPAVYPF